MIQTLCKSGAPVTYQVAHMVTKSKYLQDGNCQLKGGAGQLGGAWSVFLLVFLRDLYLSCMKLQIRKALGNKRVTGEYYTPAWHGATECSLQGWPCPASPDRAAAEKDGVPSPFLRHQE